MKSEYSQILVATPPINHEWYEQPADAIRKAAAALSQVPGIHLTFLGVFSISAEIGSGEVNLMPPERLEKEIEEKKAEHRANIESYTKWFADNDIPHSIHVATGDPADLILKYSKEWNADIILLGTHHKHGVLDIFTANIASKVIKNAPCDVMLISPGKR